uniref:protein SULFUR DEFICIENCY-INDUCED 1-like n=1 Tax=Erigeron canadensis TaxID=72917 RepID=UPI001CB9BC29|nr:protein SULFUR DEFICIENCY-INDUCED 1-like [Erigeron canadensis]
MWTTNKTHSSNSDFTPTGFPFYTPQRRSNHRTCSSNPFPSPPPATRKQLLPTSEKKWKPPQPHPHPQSQSNSNNNSFRFIHKVPAGDSPYGRAKHVQLVDKNPSKAVAMFWAAINLGDRVDSALKDMATAMKQLNRSEEAIEAIKSFRHLCPLEAQESLDNIMLELYKRSGRLDEQIHLLESRIKQIEDSAMHNVNRTRIARSQGKRIQMTMGQEYSRLLGNLAWAYLQLDKYKLAEEIYRKALSLEPDKNKQCNLAICLMYTDRMIEGKFLLNNVKDSNRSRDVYESYAKSYERAIQVMHELESCSFVTSFSMFLSRNKETDSSEEAGNDNCDSMQPETPYTYQKPCLLPLNGIPNTPYTQPCDKAGHLNGGCLRKLQFGQLAENQDLEMKLPSKPRKSWADMAEEEEEYGDENVDCFNTVDIRG